MQPREKKLSIIAQEIACCQKCELFNSAANPVAGEGNPEAEIVFVGEAPGYHEDLQGRPFVGQAGVLLERCLKEIDLSREDVFISNVLHHRPPGNRDPLATEIAACKGYLFRQLEAIKPKILVTLGRFSMNLFLSEAKISRDHGIIKQVSGFDFYVFPMFHPAAALRTGKVMSEFQEDFKKLGKLLALERRELIATPGEQNGGRNHQSEQMGLEL